MSELIGKYPKESIIIGVSTLLVLLVFISFGNAFGLRMLAEIA